MKTLARFVVMIGAGALFAGCGGSQPPTGAPGAMLQSSTAASNDGARRMTTSSYRVVYSFRHTKDGGRPDGSLIDVNGAIYGTTRFGGRGTCSISGGTGCGTVYRLDPQSGRKKVLYSFRGGVSDGAYPNGALLDVDGTLYGTTEYGGGGCGSYGCGTVYSVSMTGTETMLHTFDNKGDGTNPSAGLIDVNGTLYGTAELNGGGSGTVYTITTSGSETVLHNFRGGSDGSYPIAGLIDVKGTLYGTTLAGGSSDYGTVYSITTTGAEKVLHSFSSSPDGAMPSASLIDVSGTLYGTTPAGGDKTCYEVGPTACGVVYSITTSGKEKVLYTFTPGNDGASYPYAGLVNVKGVMYGTTLSEGNGIGCYQQGCGVIYSVTTTGYEKALHVFNGGTDGAHPDSTMIDVDGTLYGTTPNGGASNCAFYGKQPVGCGTVFALTP